MSRDFVLFLKDIRTCCEKILRFTKGINDCSSLVADEEKFDAVMHNLQIIGEAAKHLPAEIQNQIPEVAWREIKGLRDIIVHEYFGIDVEIIWDIIQNRIPDLLVNLKSRKKGNYE